MEQEELDEKLLKHAKWVHKRPGGVRADFSGCNLSGMDLSNLNLFGARFYRANLCETDFSHSDLTGVTFSGANLIKSKFCHANLDGSNFIGANLFKVSFYHADLKGANFRGANLRGADLRRIITDTRTSHLPPIACPETGSFIGYGRAYYCVSDPECGVKRVRVIVKLRIGEDALRCSAVDKECRCSSATILGAEHIDGSPITDTDIVFHHCHGGIDYCIGDTVEIDDFDTDRWETKCLGIYFFNTKREAIK